MKSLWVSVLLAGASALAAAEVKKPVKTEIATVGGGCFWCLEAVFERLPGVSKVVSGYAGGTVKNPTYREVCEGATGHAEVVQIHFNPKKIGYDQLLSVFWQCHDPTTLNRQGNDIGTQYRSTIMPHNGKQKQIALKSIEKWSREFDSPITTIIEPMEIFYKAEEYHQHYYRLNSNAPFCTFIIEPKLKQLIEKKVLPN